ncbi:hypothetical protein SISNIDRAFT_489752 [Sistotremastrum niveocremeum HHB9708]|uniref:DUF6535 domain-containing protein n=1 Tax=Sistotremastrum niveocremeum HHB9708 TaxID=1314777 RepID=A0A164PNW3_9AGAM|nr:hypothetical protein SISNIDRAFT_489752 [Sistotremastrum niveocremeum HHB9708]
MESAISAAGSASNLNEPLVSRFDRLLALMEVQNGLIKEQSRALLEQKVELAAQHRTLRKHTTMLQSIEKDATKGECCLDSSFSKPVVNHTVDDRAHEERQLKDEQTWGALDKESLAKIKVKVEQWRDLMNVSLIFIALFLTVVTAFISPVIALFTSPNSGGSKSSLPPRSTQFVALFYYLALIVSILNSVLCVLAIQWAQRLIATPTGKTNLERALAREARTALAEGYMMRLMGVLVWTLLLSISFFVIGFLIQLWELALSPNGRTPILIVGGALASGMTLIILGVIVITTVQAALHSNSPFESPLSNAMQPLLRWFHRKAHLLISNKTEQLEAKGDGPPHDDDDSERSVQDPESIEDLIRWEDHDSKDLQIRKAYARLVLNTTDTDILERAVPSFKFSRWYNASEPPSAIFLAVYDRFLATDTSIRAKETVYKQLVYFQQWNGWTQASSWPPLTGRTWRTDLKANQWTRWCRTQLRLVVDQPRASLREFIPALSFFASLEENNQDLRIIEPESDVQCVSRILCSFERDAESGYREDVLLAAVGECRLLLENGNLDDLHAILSNVDHLSVLKSLIRGPWARWYNVKPLITFMTKGKELEILIAMSDFFSDLPDMNASSDADMPLSGDPLLIASFLEELVDNLPADFTMPPRLDLSPLLRLIDKSSQFWHHCNVLIRCLESGGFDTLSDLRPASALWRHCRDVSQGSHLRRDDGTAAIAFFQLYEACFVRQFLDIYILYYILFTYQPALPGLSDEECQDLSANIRSSICNQDIRSTQQLKRPLLELLYLTEEQKKIVISQILNHGNVPRHHFLVFLIEKSKMEWDQISELVAYITQDHEIELSTLVMPISLDGWSHVNVSVDHHRAASLFLDFLALIIPSLPPQFTAPREFDLSKIIWAIIVFKPDRQSWRKHTDTIMFYLDHGVFGLLGDELINGARAFFFRCLGPSPRMRSWDPAEQTSEYAIERARFYLRVMEDREAAIWGTPAESNEPPVNRTQPDAGSLRPPGPPRSNGDDANFSLFHQLRQFFSPREWRSGMRRYRPGNTDLSLTAEDIELERNSFKASPAQVMLRAHYPYYLYLKLPLQSSEDAL